MQTITVGSKSYNLVAMPESPAPAAIEAILTEGVAEVVNPFTGQVQTQPWVGSESWGFRITMPPGKWATVAPWIAFLANLQGIQNVFQMADPEYPGSPQGAASGLPVTSGTNAAMTNMLSTSGWKANQFRLLLPGDQLQLGYRMYFVVDAAVNSDANGDATFRIWPSLREAVNAGTQVQLDKPQGLFRLAQNRRGWQSSPMRATTMSFEVTEAR